MKKYNKNDIYYVRYPQATLRFNEGVVICEHYKVGRRAFVNVRDAEGNIIHHVSVKKLRRRGR